TWPANVRHLDCPQRRNHIIADAAGIRDRGIRTNPDAFINSMTEMLGKLAEDVPIDLRSGFGHVDRQFNSLWALVRRSCSNDYQGESGEKLGHGRQSFRARSANERSRKIQLLWL